MGCASWANFESNKTWLILNMETSGLNHRTLLFFACTQDAGGLKLETSLLRQKARIDTPSSQCVLERISRQSLKHPSSSEPTELANERAIDKLKHRGFLHPTLDVQPRLRGNSSASHSLAAARCCKHCIAFSLQLVGRVGEHNPLV